jgi:hypothetical protein
VLATVGGILWGPVILTAATALRPIELSQASQPSDAELHALIAPALQQLRIIIGLYFAALAVLVLGAILAGRRAAKGRMSERLFVRLGFWALWLFVGGILLGMVPLLMTAILPSRFSFLPAQTAAVLISIILAGALDCVILLGVALFRPTFIPAPTQAKPSSRAWRVGMRFCLGAALLVGLAAFLLLAYAAQFIVAFYLRFRFVF